jgi:hypothetical protein
LSVISQLSRARPECVRALDSYKQMSDCTKWRVNFRSTVWPTIKTMPFPSIASRLLGTTHPTWAIYTRGSKYRPSTLRRDSSRPFIFEQGQNP